MNQKKTLKDLTLLDRFLFAEVMDKPENLQTILEIILGHEIILKYLPQTEKESRKSPLYRYVKLDVWTKDMENTIYDTEVQNTDTKNLPKRSRYYQGMIDSKLLEPGDIDFNKLNQIFIIIISPFDLFGGQKYKYTFRMRCDESPNLTLNDGAVRIFLNTHGQNPDDVSYELVELLKYMENTNSESHTEMTSKKLLELKRQVDAIKSNEEVSVKYMQAWEERILDKMEARAEGLAEGRTEGLAEGRAEGRAEGHINGRIEEKANEIRLIRRKLEKTLSSAEIADWMEVDEEYISSLAALIEAYPEETDIQISERYFTQKSQADSTINQDENPLRQHSDMHNP